MSRQFCIAYTTQEGNKCVSKTYDFALVQKIAKESKSLSHISDKEFLKAYRAGQFVDLSAPAVRDDSAERDAIAEAASDMNTL